MKKSKSMSKQKLSFLALCIGALALVFSACGAKEELPEPPPTFEEPEVEEAAPLVYPLTGLEAPDEQAVANRIISVKIENTPDARPQLGVARADVVYESNTEGGITRFNCMYQSDVPEEVGPVRSARDSDMSIVPEYNAFFYFSGANSLVYARLATTAINEMSQAHTESAALYHRVSYKAAPHNLYLYVDKTYETAAAMGYPLTDTMVRTLEFDLPGETYDISGKTEVAEFQSQFSSGTYNPDWTWDAASGTWLRSIQGNPQVDAADNSQIAAENVVILWQDYVPAADVPGKGQTYNVDMTGTGVCRVYRDGVKIDGTWSSDGQTPPRFTDAAGNPIPLKPGKTWFQIVPTGNDVVEQLAGGSASSEASAADTA